MRILSTLILLISFPVLGQELSQDVLIAISNEACQCIANIDSDIENKNEEIKKCINGSISAKSEVKQVSEEENLKLFKTVESVLIQQCSPLKELAFSENRKFKHSYSENVLAQLAYDDGMEFLSDGDLESAIGKFQKAVGIDEKFAFAWDNLGICYRKNGEYDKAIEAYLKSLEIYDEGRLPLLNIAITYNLDKQYKEAIKYYRKFIDIYSEDPEGYYGLGLILYTQDQQEEGLDNLIHAFTIYTAQDSPYRADAAKKIGYMYKDLKRQDKLDVFHKVAAKYNLKIENNSSNN